MSNVQMHLALTATDLQAMSVAALTLLYNDLVPAKPIKKFETKAQGVARVTTQLDLLRAADQRRQMLAHDRQLLAPKTVTKEPAPEYLDTTPRAAKQAKAPKTSRTDTVSAVMRQLLLEGKSNAEVWAVCQPRFGLQDSQKYYPAWYRRQLAQQGRLAQEG